jgi:hypothetical protein
VSCKRMKNLWPLWSSGDLEGKKLERFETHLASCATCRAASEALRAASRQTLQALKGQAVELPTEAEWARMLAIARPERPRRWRTLAWVTAAVSALALVAALALSLLLPRENPRPVDPREGVFDEVMDDGFVVVLSEEPRDPAEARPRTEGFELRAATSDPKVKIVWSFDRNQEL